jgi:metallo-beta-lactamase family protein
MTVGYMAENTLGRRIRNRESEVKIHGEWFKLKAHVEEINAFSAHADYYEILEWLKALDTSRLKRIFLVHGEKKSQVFLQKYLNEKGFPDVVIVKYKTNYELT